MDPFLLLSNHFIHLSSSISPVTHLLLHHSSSSVLLSVPLCLLQSLLASFLLLRLCVGFP